MQRIDDPDLDIDETCVIVLKSVGPVGYPGMPEVGNVDLPEKLLRKGIKDMIRISDGRMSGTAAGTVILACFSGISYWRYIGIGKKW